MAGEVYDARKEFPMEHGLMEDCGERFHLVKVQNYGMKQLIPVDTVPVVSDVLLLVFPHPVNKEIDKVAAKNKLVNNFLCFIIILLNKKYALVSII